MKRTRILFALAALFCLSKGSYAQITAVNITGGALDSFSRYCVPTSNGLFLSGTVTGTVTVPVDSLTVKVTNGDGTDFSYRIPVSPTKTFFSVLPAAHTYTAAGTYTAKAVVTASSGAADSLISAPFTLDPTCITSTVLKGFASDSMSKCALPYDYYLNINGETFGSVGSTDSATISINFGDGSDTTIRTRILGSTTYGYYFTYLKHRYTMTGTFAPLITAVISGSGATDTVVMPSFSLSDSCATVSGKLYIDDNLDCLADVGEDGVPYIPIKVENTATGIVTTSPAWSDMSGNYAVNLAPGTYIITPDVHRSVSGWSAYGGTVAPSCPSTGSVTLTVAPLTTYTKDFAYECKSLDTFDISAYAYSTCYVTGDTSLFSVWAGSYWSYYHYVCFDMPTTVTLTLDADLSYAGTYYGAAPASVSGKVITWNITGTEIGSFSRTIKVAVATTALLGDSLTSTVYIAPVAGIIDPVLSDNTFVHSRVVVSSYDPNEKEAAPSGVGPRGFIPVNTPMTYTIHFQNTGTAPARNITILDTLERNLDASSFHMLTSSHNAMVYTEGNVVKFRFNNIYLPDSGADYYGSMGSVTYAVLPKRDLAPGTEIKNRAGIYFDYNDPIITNYTVNTINIPTTIQELKLGNIAATVFPNPAHTVLNIKMEQNNSCSVSLVDMLGHRIAQGQSAHGTVAINTEAIPSGLYIVFITDDAGHELKTKVNIVH